MGWVYGFILVLALVGNSHQREYINLKTYTDGNCKHEQYSFYMDTNGDCSCLNENKAAVLTCKNSIYCCGTVNGKNVSMTCSGLGIVYAIVAGELGSHCVSTNGGNSFKLQLINYQGFRTAIIVSCTVLPVAFVSFVVYALYVNFKVKQGCLYCPCENIEEPSPPATGSGSSGSGNGVPSSSDNPSNDNPLSSIQQHNSEIGEDIDGNDKENDSEEEIK